MGENASSVQVVMIDALPVERCLDEVPGDDLIADVGGFGTFIESVHYGVKAVRT